MGHLVTLKDPEGYDKRYKSWELDHLPIVPKKAEFMVLPKTAFQYKAIKDLIHRNDIKEIIIATDAGREGELVARLILELANNKKPIKRLWISSVTDRAILDGFKNLKDGKAYIPLYHSALARAQSDWLVGINATRALTTKHNAQLSCGRVQTPTLSMVAKKEEEVRAFRPKDFYTVKISAGGCEFTWQDNKSGAHRIFDKEQADCYRSVNINSDGSCGEKIHEYIMSDIVNG
jgi:DNA topoisomerase-3